MRVLKYFNDISQRLRRFRSSHPRCSVRKGVLRNLAKFPGKDLCQSLSFNKVSRLRPATLSKKRLWHRRFSMNFSKFLGTPFLQNTSRQLILMVQKFMNQFCFTTFSFNYFKSSADSFFLVFPSRLFVTFDIQIDLKMKSTLEANSEAHSEPCQTSKTEIFTKIVSGFSFLTIFAKTSILDV